MFILLHLHYQENHSKELSYQFMVLIATILWKQSDDDAHNAADEFQLL